MATLTSGDTLSLKDIYSASLWTHYYTPAQTTNLSMGQIRDFFVDNQSWPANSAISMSGAGIDSIGSINGYTYVVEGTNEDYTVSIGGAGNLTDLFNKYGYNGGFHTAWIAETDPQNVFGGLPSTEGASEHNGINLYASAFSDGLGGNDGNTDGVLDTVKSAILRFRYNDGVNHHVDGFNGVKAKIIYWVDSYDGNSAALCLTIDSPVTLADGTIVEAGDLNEGDTLKGFSIGGLGTDSDGTFLDWSTPELSTTPKDVTIVNLTYSFAPRYYDINNGQVTATAEHPMLVKDLETGTYMFKEMFKLKVGDKLIKGSGVEYSALASEVEITSIDVVNKTTEIVSIDVEQEDTYMVNGYITHNKGGNSHSDFSGPDAPTSVTYSSPLITWTAPADQTPNGVTAYEWQASLNNPVNSPFAQEDEWSTTEVEVDTILGPGQWYFRVRAIESGLKGAWSDTLSFIVP